MDMEKLAAIFESVKVMPLRPNDFIVFRSSHALGPEQMAMVHAYLEEQTGHSRILIMTGGADLDVLRMEPESPAAAPAPEPARPKMGKAPGAIA